MTALIIVLTTVAMVSYQNSVTRAREAVLKEDLFRLRDAIDQYYADKNKWPQIAGGSGHRRLRARDPEGSDDRLGRDVADRAGRGRSRPIRSAEPGVFDVKSGSDRMALDGTPYTDW